MSQFSTLERMSARLLSRFPAVKSFIKKHYSRLVYLRAKKLFKHKSVAVPKAIKNDGRPNFFGYYDKSPANSNGLMLVNWTKDTTKKRPTSADPAYLTVLGPDGLAIAQKTLHAYNWQQGARAHWLTTDLYIYNDYDKISESYISRVCSVASGEETNTFSYPVQDSYQTHFFISLNYQRLLSFQPDYAYRNLPAMKKSLLNDLENDGLWRVDFETGAARLLVTLKQAIAIRPRQYFKQASHCFNHVMISPDGNRLVFLHRVFLEKRRFDRLFMAEVNTGRLKLLSDKDMVSHYFWADNSTILGYMRGPNGQDGYWLVDISTGQFTSIAKNELGGYGDGHPNVYGDWFVTDTYPDKSRMQHLLLCNWRNGKVYHLGEFFHGFEFSDESRCDLHPRFSPDGRFIFFDSVFNGQRQLYRLEIPR